MKNLFLFLFVLASGSILAQKMTYTTVENCKLKVTELTKIYDTGKTYGDGAVLSFKDCSLKNCFLVKDKTMYNHNLLEEFLKSASGKKLTITTSDMEGKNDPKTNKIYINDCYKVKIDGVDKVYINENNPK